MSSAIMNPSPSSHSGRNGRVSFGAHGSSLLLERAKANANRRPTPDSEVMVSSDEEHPSGQAQPGLRRGSTSRPATSWLSDIGQSQPQPARKYSLGGISVSSNNSQPPTPSSEATPRLTATGQGRNNSGVTFSGNIWAPDRTAANRFSDTPHSPLSLAPLSSDQSASGSQGRRYSGIGVDIPLKPTFKPSQQRAMSFSAAQQIPSDDDEVALPFHVHRLRTATQANITRKASLSQVREDEDGDDSGVHLPTEQGGASQNLLRRAVRQRTFSSNAPGLSESGWNASARRASTLPFTETAVEELDDYPSAIPESRRHSLAHVATRPHAPSSLSSRTYIEPQQYASHNNNPTTNTFSPSSNATLLESASGSDYFYQHQTHLDEAQVPSEHYHNTMWNEDRQQEYLMKELHSGQQLGPNMGNFGLSTNNELADPVFARFRQMNAELGGQVVEIKHPIHENLNRYFNGVGVEQRVLNEGPNPPQVHVPEQRSTAPAKVAPPPAPKTYHLIKFKCERAEVYTMPDNTGLTIDKGQLVIVEGDRGYDIGEVEKANISLGEVKALRQSSQEKHFIWLMMFSRARETNPTVRWALSNLDPHNASARHPENDPEPESRSQNFKMIKRLAIPVEFASLQEKEGDETKAKRICQQKVLEHGLDMEILDAEFQLDRHKLTYFYYAEKYINFNELVNDLFKIFKTRIWMSAVNPASFAPGGNRGHGGSPPTAAASETQPNQPMSYAAAYGAQSTLAHTREVQAARHEASMHQASMNPVVQPRFAGVPPIQYTGLPPAFGAGYGQNAHAAAATTGNAYNSATPVNTGVPPSNSSGFNPYAQPFTNTTWAPNTPYTWGATPPKANTGQNPSVQSPIGHPSPRNAAPESPRNAPHQHDRQRKPSTEDDARNEAVRAAFYSKVTSGMQGMSLGDGSARRGSFK